MRHPIPQYRGTILDILLDRDEDDCDIDQKERCYGYRIYVQVQVSFRVSDIHNKMGYRQRYHPHENVTDESMNMLIFDIHTDI